MRPRRTRVNGRGGQPSYLTEQVRFGVMSEVVRLRDTQIGRNRDVDLSAQRVPDPTDTQVPYLINTGHTRHRSSGLIDKGGVNCVEQSSPDLPNG